MKIRPLLLICLLMAGQAPAQEPMASEASIRDLLTASKTEKMLDGMWAQLDSLMETSMQESLAGQPLTLRQQAVIDDMRKEMLALMKDELSWSNYEPMMIDIYRNTFSESEIQGMLQFYRSPAGEAVLNKMPIVMQASMQAVQGRMAPLQAKMQDLQQRTLAKLQEVSAE
jgi:hypothetical protein